ncbi:MAG: 2-C-methyl-D-erythritol 4-phosphate cytidylyltransferase [Clostridia bacterium]|jgi:2-C-methyl-D-erythritol 4-phosphate cytidylyltransferase|nr:ispD [Clostridiales bacterium]MDK2985936.1 2-C-methyl-D-erythritol 4-phosphate cytidylyltransferase [Clostridia bacterium]
MQVYRAASIVVAGGKGSRMGTKVKKQYLDLQGMPILAHTLSVFETAKDISHIVLVVPEEDIEFCRENIKHKYDFTKISQIVAGGKTRGESVFNGLRKTFQEDELVAVHDGARPLLNAAVLTKGIAAAGEYGASVVAVRVKDTIKRAGNDNFVRDTLPREELWAVQTPQVFKRDLLLKCYRKAFAEGVKGTDDASIVEYYGHQVKIVEGEYENIKVTTPEDLVLANAILAYQKV